MRKKILAGVLAALTLFAAPTAADAATYVPSGGCIMTPATVDPGDNGTFECSAGTFKAGELVTYTVSGTNGTHASLADFTAATSSAATTTPHVARGSATIVKAALEDGGSSVLVHVPANASGTYALTAKSASRTVTSSVSVLPADGKAAMSNSASTTGLASTGSDVAIVFGGVGGIIVLFAAVLFFFGRSRRRRAQ